MPDFDSLPALDGAPKTIGACTLAPVDLGPITSIMPYKGKVDTLSSALKSAHGLRWPSPGKAVTGDSALAAWSGKGQALLIGAAPGAGLSDHAALVDQSDAWAAVTLKGPSAAQVQSRLCPLDLRPATFPPGQSARSLLQHCPALFICDGPESFTVLTYRSMAGTAWHDLTRAAQRLAARQALTRMDAALD